MMDQCIIFFQELHMCSRNMRAISIRYVSVMRMDMFDIDE